VRTLACIAVLLSLSAIAAPSRADDDPKEVARAHYARGLELAAQGLYEGALEQFNAAYAKSPHYAVLYNIGQAQIALGRPIEAIEALTKYLRDGQEQVPLSRRQQVEAQVALLEAKLAELTITTDRPGALITIDGREVGRTPLYQPVRLAAGTHVVTVAVDGLAPITQTVVAREAERQTLTLVVPAAVTAAAPAAVAAPPIAAAPAYLLPPPRRDLRKWAYAAAAAGVAAGGAALGVYLWNRGRYEDWQAANQSLQRLTPGSAAYYEEAMANNARADSLTTANHVIAGLAVAGGVLIAGGVGLYLVDRAQRRAEANVAAGWSFDVAVGARGPSGITWRMAW
jgi:tetratricopeptide (TPR) repeat protein